MTAMIHFKNKYITSLILLMSFAYASAQTSLNENEELVYTFRTVNGKNIQIVKDKDDKYIFYRASKNGKIELEYPEKNIDSWKKFRYVYYFRPNQSDLGMDLNYLEFFHEGYKYVVYDIFYDSGNEHKIGVRCEELTSKKYFDHKAFRRTVKGNLTQLINNELIESSVGQLFE